MTLNNIFLRVQYVIVNYAFTTTDTPSRITVMLASLPFNSKALFNASSKVVACYKCMSVSILGSHWSVTTITVN